MTTGAFERRSPGFVEAVRELRAQEHALDAGLSHVPFRHTGGTPALFAYADVLLADGD